MSNPYKAPALSEIEENNSSGENQSRFPELVCIVAIAITLASIPTTFAYVFWVAFRFLLLIGLISFVIALPVAAYSLRSLRMKTGWLAASVSVLTCLLFLSILASISISRRARDVKLKNAADRARQMQIERAQQNSVNGLNPIEPNE